MARITVEDCLAKLPNRFELVLLSTKRARDLAIYQAEPLVDPENDKFTVVALREIAEGKIDMSYLEVKPSNPFNEAVESMRGPAAAATITALPEEELPTE